MKDDEQQTIDAIRNLGYDCVERDGVYYTSLDGDEWPINSRRGPFRNNLIRGLTMLDADTAAQALRECQPELDRLISLNVQSLDFYRATEAEKAEIIDAVYALMCCVMACDSVAQCEAQSD